MRKDDGVDGDAQRIGQLTWMLLLKVFDQKEEEWADAAATRGETYKYAIPEECRWGTWAAYVDDKPQTPASELIEYVNSTVFPKLKDLSTEELDEDARAKKVKVVSEVFRDSNNYMKSGTLMLEVIEKLDDAIDFHNFTTRQQLGDIYEQVLNDLRSAGNAGEFYTPRAITQFMVRMVDPKLHKNEKVLDPACGTGGFLTAAYNRLKEQADNKSGIKIKNALEHSIKGIEKKQLPHLLCTTNMLLHGIEIPDQIEHRNTLAKSWNEWSNNDKVDCVITNPPFGGSEEDGVGADFPTHLLTRETSDMFLTLIVKKLLKPDGRGAIVLPDGNLFGEGVKAKVKEELLKECNLHTIIRIPNGVFNPYTGIKTNLLFFTKGKPTETIWYYEHPYPPGYKSYSKTKPITLDEFRPEISWWGNESDGFASRIENEFAWKIDFKTKKEEAEGKAGPYWDKAEKLNKQVADIESNIKELRRSLKDIDSEIDKLSVETEITGLQKQAEKLRQHAKDEQAAGDRIYWPFYNLDEKNPNTPEAIKHDPDELLKEYKKLQKEIANTEKQLKQELAKAFAHHFTEEQA